MSTSKNGKHRASKFNALSFSLRSTVAFFLLLRPCSISFSRRDRSGNCEARCTDVEESGWRSCMPRMSPEPPGFFFPFRAKKEGREEREREKKRKKSAKFQTGELAFKFVRHCSRLSVHGRRHESISRGRRDRRRERKRPCVTSKVGREISREQSKEELSRHPRRWIDRSLLLLSLMGASLR